MYIIVFIYNTIKIFSDHSGKVIGNHISVQSPTFGNGFYAYIDGRMLVTSNNYICYSTIQHSLFQVNKIYRENQGNFFFHTGTNYTKIVLLFLCILFIHIWFIY